MGCDDSGGQGCRFNVGDMVYLNKESVQVGELRIKPSRPLEVAAVTHGSYYSSSQVLLVYIITPEVSLRFWISESEVSYDE